MPRNKESVPVAFIAIQLVGHGEQHGLTSVRETTGHRIAAFHDHDQQEANSRRLLCELGKPGAGHSTEAEWAYAREVIHALWYMNTM